MDDVDDIDDQSKIVSISLPPNAQMSSLMPPNWLNPAPSPPK